MILNMNVGGANSPRIKDVNLLAANWDGITSPYSQIVDIDDVTPFTQVDLTPNIDQLKIFHDKDLAFVTENEGGVVTVYALGQKPENDYTMQVTLTETDNVSGKIIGITVGTTVPKSNLMQADPTKGDYVKGKDEFLENAIPTKVSDFINDADYASTDYVDKAVDANQVNIDEVSDAVADLSGTVSTNYNQSVIALSVDGRTVTYITGDGVAHTFETQDTDTIYSLGTDEVTGLTKLYATTGNAEDGTMTQKAIKTELDKKVGVSVDDAQDMLIFTI